DGGHGKPGLAAFLAAVARRDVVFLGVLHRALLDHRTNQRLVRLDPVADDLPLRPVPLLELHRSSALVVGAGDLVGLDEAGRPQLREPGVIDLDVLQSPAHLLAGERLLAELPLGDADALDGDDPGEHSAVVEDAPDAGLVDHVALAGTVDDPLDLLDD